MSRIILPVIGLVFGALSGSLPAAGEPPAEPEPPKVFIDEVLLKDGSRVVGEIQSMVGGKLTVKSLFAVDDTVVIDWDQVQSIRTEAGHNLTVVLAEGSAPVGVVAPGGEGRLTITASDIALPMEVALASVAAINPPPEKDVTFKGALNLAASTSDGNTRTKSLTLFGDMETRVSDDHRITLRAGYTYAEDEDGLTARNGRVGLKYDYFFTKRLYAFAATLFEYDTFQDLNLRTAVSAGPGWQIIDKGDFTSEAFSEMTLLAEIGVSYFNEDFDDADDDSYVAGRWAVKFDWPFIPKQVTAFHFHEGYPGFEDLDDLYISSEQGLKFAIADMPGGGKLIATLQVNWRWDNTPAPGNGRDDTLYLASIGYSWGS
jgi:putative salt-induced outer membrane protein YdiY